MVRTTDLENDNFTSGVKYITQSSYDYLSKSKLFGGEVLINKIGTPGKTYIMPKLNVPMSLGMNLFMLKMNGKNIDEVTLYLYLNSCIGKNIIQRKVNGTVPLTIDKNAIKSLYIPVFSNDFRKMLNKLMIQYDSKNQQSKKLYQQAEELLLKELGLDNFNPISQTSSIKSLKDSFYTTGRLDSEYYQTKYDELICHIKSYVVKSLVDIVTIDKSIEPGSQFYQQDGIPFVRVQDLTQYEIKEPSVFLSREIFSQAIQPKKDTILLSKDGSVCVAHKAANDMDLITSSAILHLQVNDKNILSDYLTLVLNSLVGKMQAERDTGGSIIKHWRIDDIKNTLIPIINVDKQLILSDLLKQSNQLRQYSKKLIEASIQAVEIAIEHGENEASNFLNQINEL